MRPLRADRLGRGVRPHRPRSFGRCASPDHAAFYTSGRASNEAAFLYQLFARQFGTNNLPDCSNMCHESSGTALVESLGIGKGTVTLDDFEQTDLILIVGQNPGTNHPRMLTSLEHAKKHGAKIIAINPLAEPGFLRFTDPNPDEYPTPVHFAASMLGPGMPLADLHLPVRINGDIALLKGLMKVLLAEDETRGGVLDHDFIRDHTDGFAELYADLEATAWQEIVDGCGIAREEIERAGRMIAGSKRMICCWAMGLTQHRDAVATIRMLVNILLLGGHIGRPGAGTCCVRGHSNVQGDRTMGIWERPTGPFLDALDKEFGFASPAQRRPRHGRHHLRDARGRDQRVRLARRQLSLGHAGHGVHRGGAAALLAHGAHRHQAQPRPPGHRTAGADPPLPGTFGAGPGRVPDGGRRDGRGQLVHRAAGAGGDVRCEASRPSSPASPGRHWVTGPRSTGTVSPATTPRCVTGSARVVPGFESYNARDHEGAVLPPQSGPRPPLRHLDRQGPFRGGPDLEARAGQRPLSADDDPQPRPVQHDHLRPPRSLSGRPRRPPGPVHESGGPGRARVEAASRVDITSHFGGERRVARRFQLVPYDIPRRCVAAYYPEANVLVPLGSVAEESNTPTYKSIHVSLQAAETGVVL